MTAARGVGSGQRRVAGTPFAARVTFTSRRETPTLPLC